jgi:GGDEF domain-containing protein
MGEAADPDAEVWIPRSALDSVQRALASVHAAVGLRATLQAIAEGLATLLRRIEEAFARDPVRIGDLSLHLSCSLGLVCEPGGAGVRPGSAAERAEELLSNADREMYAHKRSRAGVHRLLQRSPGGGV